MENIAIIFEILDAIAIIVALVVLALGFFGKVSERQMIFWGFGLMVLMMRINH